MERPETIFNTWALFTNCCTMYSIYNVCVTPWCRHHHIETVKNRKRSRVQIPCCRLAATANAAEADKLYLQLHFFVNRTSFWWLKAFFEMISLFLEIGMQNTVLTYPWFPLEFGLSWPAKRWSTYNRLFIRWASNVKTKGGPGWWWCRIPIGIHPIIVHFSS